MTFGGKTTIQGAQTTIYCAVSEEMDGLTGKFVVDCRIRKPNSQALDDKIADESFGKSITTSWSVSQHGNLHNYLIVSRAANRSF